mgnify:CR=1 FL=1
MSPAVLTGRCLCGAITLTITPPTDFVSHCHCASCRVAHAAPFVTWTSVPEQRFTMTGEPHLFESSAGVHRGFCGRCGTQVLYRADATPGRVYVPVGILDGIDRAADSHVSYEERAGWIEGLERLPCFAGKSQRTLAW